MADPEKFVGICAVMPNGILPVLSRQNGNVADGTPGTNVSVKPVIEVVLPSGQLVPPAIANEAVDAVNVFGDNATVFDCRFAKVIPPAKAATAPIVPMARANGLILRKLNIRYPLT